MERFPDAAAERPEVSDDLAEHNARLVYEDVLKDAPKVKEDMGGCRGEVLRGIIRSESARRSAADARLKGRWDPAWSAARSCNISYRYRE